MLLLSGFSEMAIFAQKIDFVKKLSTLGSFKTQITTGQLEKSSFYNYSAAHIRITKTPFPM